MAPQAPPAEPQDNDKVEEPGSQTPDPNSPSESSEDKSKAPAADKDTVLPDEHPLMVKHAEIKGKLAKANSDLAEARAQAKRTTELEGELEKRPTTEVVETLQTRYDRLEGFLQAVGGPLSKALDSRSFTRELFETDKDVKDIVKDYMKANPTATSQALGGKAAAPADKAPDMNTLIRASRKK